ncbi:DEAD/DEAH box helicase family protein [Mycoplasma miroungigenitalium]|uniref:DEAD/DEAH box helicase family protein n=1 Tax=Mycoplasma miroungigenitalium TaxID=754515 RepID=A0A6M4JB93_9MOLU|nr:SNF2-related protein [Mycoplasma miroungigenitalium]QJR43655.1 DEAD/DEAH box helicase family protein [Mycoplasma miroungigenitalium]
MTKQLYEYQKQAVAKALSHDRFLLALDMGLGKTLCACTWLLNVIKSQQDSKINSVIVCDSIKLSDWKNELIDVGIENVKVVDKVKSLKEFKDFDKQRGLVYVISYGKLTNALGSDKELMTSDFNLIIDESQALKNKSSKRTLRLLSRSKYIKKLLLLSGDPISTGYVNLWPQMKILQSFVDGFSYWDFERSFCKVETSYGQHGSFKSINGYKNTDELMQILYKKAYFLKTEEVQELPKKRTFQVETQPSSYYKKVEKGNSLITSNFNFTSDSIIKQYHGLRQLASGVIKDDSGQFQLIDNGKLDRLKDLIESSTYNFTLFYNYRAEAYYIKELCKSLDINVFEINGKHNDLEKVLNCVERFIVLIHYASGARGVDGLQFKVFNQIYYSPPNSGEMFRQSLKRVHRIGQSKCVNYYFFHNKNTIETHVYECLKQHKDYSIELFKHYLNERRNE